MPASLSALISRAQDSQSRPPVERWHPDYCGALDMRISPDGSWHYMGSPIGREALVRLFASVLRKDEDGETYLVTPVEKIRITVEDAPFQAVEMAVVEDSGTAHLTFRTNVGDVVSVDADHPLRFAVEPETGGFKAYVLVRGRLEARLTRALMFDLVSHANEGEGEHRGSFGVASGGQFFAICSMAEVEQFGALS
nr:DUF1285 domain-containing protein [uncultured Cohaesibacter sp.]